MNETCISTAAFFAAAEELGVGNSNSNSNRNRNGSEHKKSTLFTGSFRGSTASAAQEGYGMFPVTVTNQGFRSSAAAAFLDPALAASDPTSGSATLELRASVTVDKLLFDQTEPSPQCAGVTFFNADGGQESAYLKGGGEILLAAGVSVYKRGARACLCVSVRARVQPSLSLSLSLSVCLCVCMCVSVGHYHWLSLMSFANIYSRQSIHLRSCCGQE